MPNYKVVDTEKLESDLALVADSIRANSSSSERLAWPQGYVDGANAIPEDYLTRVFNKQADKIIGRNIQATLPAAFQAGVDKDNPNTNLLEVDLPLISAIPTSCFQYCTFLNKVNLPSVQTVADSAFNNCKALEQIIMPSLLTCDGYGNHFSSCSKLKRVILPVYSGAIKRYMFNNNAALETLVLGGDTVCEMEATSALGGTPIINGSGYVYFRKHLVDIYKSATNWSAIANQIRAIEENLDILPEMAVTFTVRVRSGEATEYTTVNYKTWGEWAIENGYEVLESGAIFLDGTFLAPYGKSGTEPVLSSDIISAGDYWFID